MGWYLIPQASQFNITMRQRSQGGFTLLELTIVLAIVGLLAVGALKAVSALRENAGISETSKRLDTLVMALQTFLMKHNRLPCPADPNLPDTHLNFGLEAREARDDDDKEKCTLPGIPPAKPQFYRGVIPGRALGLSGGRLLDAWDRQFTYAVVIKATKTDSFTRNRWPPTFKLTDELERLLNEKNEGIVVIISHGANGSGAYLTDGRQTDPQGIETGQLERENFDPDFTFIQAPYSTNERNPFDDKVLVLTEDQIVQPLANQGALQTKHAQTLEILKRIENALIGFIIIKHVQRQCSPPQIWIPSAQDLSLDGVTDPWGKKIKYIVNPIVQGCFPIINNIEIKLKSDGPDDNTEDDDIDRIVTETNSQLSGTLAAAGIHIDGSGSSSSSQATTKDSKNGPP
jgi:prepilin-type N-terminal cleavage/methylation domain-containing protein